MAIVRENIMMNAGVRDAFLDGVVALDAEWQRRAGERPPVVRSKE